MAVTEKRPKRSDFAKKDRAMAERGTIDEKIGLSERMRDLASAGSYEIEPVGHSVRESRLYLFGLEEGVNS